MVKNKKSKIDDTTFFLITEKMRNKPSFHGPVLCLFTNIKFMEKIHDKYSSSDLIYVPWHWDEVKHVENKKGSECIFTSEIGENPLKL